MVLSQGSLGNGFPYVQVRSMEWVRRNLASRS